MRSPIRTGAFRFGIILNMEMRDEKMMRRLQETLRGKIAAAGKKFGARNLSGKGLALYTTVDPCALEGEGGVWYNTLLNFLIRRSRRWLIRKRWLTS